MWAVHTGFPHDKHGIRLHVVYTVCCGEYSYCTLEVGRGAILKQSCRKHFESTFKEPKVTSAHENLSALLQGPMKALLETILISIILRLCTW
jgi:hypothetical protein